MKRFFLISGLVLGLLVSTGITLEASPLFSVNQSAENYTEIEFLLDDYELVTTVTENMRFYRITHPKAAFLMDEGLPELPIFSTSIAIPYTGNARLEEINVLDKDIRTGIRIYPSQGFDLEYDPETGLLYDESFYMKDKLYPASLSEIGTPATMRDIRFVSIVVTPFRYNPANDELEINRRIRLRIEHDPNLPGENEINRPRRKLSRSFERIYRGAFLNYDDYLDPNWEYQARSILVIHHHSLTLQPIINAFVNWKRDKGFEIAATSTQNLPTNTAIKNYIQTAYDTWENPPEYVILIGGGSGSHSIPAFHNYPNYAGDHPYSLLEGNDDISDVFVGRFPIANVDQLLVIWNKIRNYEREPFIGNMDWYEHALLVGSPTGWGISTLFTPKYAKELMLLYNEDFTFSEVYYSPFGSQINAALNQGTFIFNFRGYYAFNYDWSPTDNYNNGLMMPFCFFLTCNTLDYSNNSATERMLTVGTSISPKGGIGAIGINSLESKTAYNNALSGSFTYGIYNEGIRTMGETLVRGKLFLHQTYGIVHPSQPPQFSHWVNLMGDPSMDIWVDRPKTMNVTYEEVLPLGSNYIDILVTDSQNQPIEDAWVTLRQGDDVIFVTGYTDTEGTITHLFEPDNSGEVSLTVTKPDHIPYLGSFELAGEPSVSLENVIVNDPLDAGSTVYFIVSVKNHRDDSVNGVTGSISTNSSYADIVEDSTTFGNIPAGDVAEASDLFSVSISHAAPDLIPLIFDLELSDASGNNWLSKFVLRINGNSLKPVSLLVDDSYDYVAPGETSSLQITVENQGQLDLQEVYGILRTNNPLFDISDSLAYFGDINAGESVISAVDNSFTVTAFEALITGMTVELELYLYNSLGYEGLESTSIPIGLVTVNDPYGPCDYGYYIYGMEDTDYDFAPTYEWIEIAPQLGGSGLNTGLQSNYNNVQQITTVDLPFTFRFYGIDYDEVTISANGWISFGETEQGTFRNFILPGPMGPNPIIAAFWDNLSLAQGGVYTYHDDLENQFIIQWHNARNLIGSAEETFQIILIEPESEPTIDDGFIKIQYKVFNNVNNSSGFPHGNWGNYCTAGIGDHTGDVGLTYTFANQYPTAAAPLTDESAIMIVGPENLSEPLLVRQSVVFFDENDSGVVEAGENVKLGVYIRNIGHATATNVNGTISTTSPYIVMVDNTSPYYDISSGNEEVNRDFFDFDALASAPNNYTANFQIHITSDDVDVSFPFHLNISRPALELASYMIDNLDGNEDGTVLPGETVNLVLNFKNPTHSEVKNSTVDIYSEN